MRHFTKIYDGVDVAPLLAELDAQPKLWNAHTFRKTGEGNPHSCMSDIWIRYNALDRLNKGDRQVFNNEHVPVWYPAWSALPALRPIVFDLMAVVEGEMIGGVLITRIPPGQIIDPHRDVGWHVEYYEKFYLSLRSSPGADFVCDDAGCVERLNPKPGDIHLFDNRKFHWVENNSNQERITLITCIRTGMFGRPT
jgi:hypothetical protein